MERLFCHTAIGYTELERSVYGKINTHTFSSTSFINDVIAK
jgi:hypothetical protein